MNIEGFKIELIAGHYKSDDKQSWLHPDFREVAEVTITNPKSLIVPVRSVILVELKKLLEDGFGRIIKNYEQEGGKHEPTI